MLRKLLRLISVLLILATSLYIVLLNRDFVAINLGDSQSINAPLGAILIGVFCLGVLCTALVASFFGFKAYLREKSFQREERKRIDYDNLSAKARGLTLSAQYYDATRLWEQLTKLNPKDIQPKIWLSKTLQADGKPKEALKTLDQTRASHAGDIETLLLASELNQQLGNMTSAIDNLALIISQQPNTVAVLKARDLSVQIGRLDDALEYNKKLSDLGYDTDELNEFEAKVKLEKINQNFKNADESEQKEYLLQLNKLAKEYPDCSAAYLATAELELKNTNYDKASQAFIKAAYILKSPEAWYKAINLWIDKKEPERALSVARLAIKDNPENSRTEYELLLAKTHILLGMYSEASETLKRVKAKSVSKVQIAELTKLLGVSLARDGKEKEAAELWLEIAN